MDLSKKSPKRLQRLRKTQPSSLLPDGSVEIKAATFSLEGGRFFVACLTHATQLSGPEVKEMFSDGDRTGFAMSQGFATGVVIQAHFMAQYSSLESDMVMVAANNSIQCSQCGGAASTVAGREYMQCDYCQSLIFTERNPLVVDRIVPMGETLDAASCPSCDCALSTGKIEDRPVLYCGQCFGVLIKNDVFGTVVRERRARRKGCEAEVCRPLDTSAYDRILGCPACERKMEVHPYYGPGNVVIDSCSSCEYVWVDHGELRSVERAEGAPERESLPLYVNDDGEITIIPEPEQARHTSQKSHLQSIADAVFGL